VVNAATALSAVRRHLLPAHATLDVASLTLIDVTSAMDKIAKAGKPGAAADLRKHASVFLNWAQAQGYVTHNVLAGFRQPKPTRAQRLARSAKGRALTDNEVRTVWHAAGRLGTFGLLVRLCLLGGSRRSEPTRIEWTIVPIRRAIRQGTQQTPRHTPLAAGIRGLCRVERRYVRRDMNLIVPRQGRSGGKGHCVKAG
jgi:integrase